MKVLIDGSGNLVHHLHAYAWGRHTPDPYDWAVKFETEAKALMVAGEYKRLSNTRSSETRRSYPFRLRSSSFHCYTLSRPGSRVSRSRFRLKALMGAPYRC